MKCDVTYFVVNSIKHLMVLQHLHECCLISVVPLCTFNTVIFKCFSVILNICGHLWIDNVFYLRQSLLIKMEGCVCFLCPLKLIYAIPIANKMAVYQIVPPTHFVHKICHVFNVTQCCRTCKRFVTNYTLSFLSFLI